MRCATHRLARRPLSLTGRRRAHPGSGPSATTRRRRPQEVRSRGAIERTTRRSRGPVCGRRMKSHAHARRAAIKTWPASTIVLSDPQRCGVWLFSPKEDCHGRRRKVFTDSVIPVPPAEGPTHLGLMVAATHPDTGEERMTVVFSLTIPDSAQAELQKIVAEGKIVSPKHLDKNIRPRRRRQALTSWLKSEGFKIEKVSDDRTSVYAQGTVEQIEKSLAVKMVRVTKDGITYTAAQDAPSLPESVGKSVSAIVGCSRSAARTSSSGSASRKAACRRRRAGRGAQRQPTATGKSKPRRPHRRFTTDIWCRKF